MAMVAQKVKSFRRNGTSGEAGIYSSKDDVQNKRYIKVYIGGKEHYVKFVGLDDERVTPARIVYNSGMFSLGTQAIYADRPINTTQDLASLTGSLYSENFDNMSKSKQYPPGTPTGGFYDVRYYPAFPDADPPRPEMWWGYEPWDRYPYNNVAVKLPNIKNGQIVASIHQTNSGFHDHSWWDCRQWYKLYMNGNLISDYIHQNNPSECYPITTYFPTYSFTNISEGTHHFTLRIEVIDSGGYRQQIDIYNVNINIIGTRYYTEG